MIIGWIMYGCMLVMLLVALASATLITSMLIGAILHNIKTRESISIAKLRIPFIIFLMSTTIMFLAKYCIDNRDYGIDWHRYGIMVGK